MMPRPASRPADATAPARPSRSFRPAPAARPPRPFARADLLTLIVALPCIFKAVQFRQFFAIWLIAPLLAPALLMLAWPAYHARIHATVRSLWAALDAFARDRTRPLPVAAALAFVASPALAVYLSNLHSSAQADSQPVMPTAASLVVEGDTDLNEFFRLGGWRDCVRSSGMLPYFIKNTDGTHRPTRGPVYSAYPSGMVPFALPVAAVARVSGAYLGRFPILHQMEKLAAAGTAALAAALFFLAALHLAPPAAALVAAALFAFASGMFSTSSQLLWQQGGLIFWMLVVLLAEFRQSERRGRLALLAQGIACGMLPACRPSAAIFLVPFGLWLLVRDPRRAVRVVAVAALTYLPWAVYYLAVYGKPFGPTSDMLDPGNWRWSIAWPLAGVLASPARGLLVYQPWLILPLIALVPAVRRAAIRHGARPGPSGWVALVATVAALQILMVAAWHCWWGGHCWGSRLVLEAVPLLGLLCVAPIAALIARRPGRILLLNLGLAGVLVHASMVYGKAHEWNGRADIDVNAPALWSWSRAPFLWPITKDAPPKP